MFEPLPRISGIISFLSNQAMIRKDFTINLTLLVFENDYSFHIEVKRSS